MLLGKRARPPMTRTTSMSEITFDLNTVSTEEAPPSSDNNHHLISQRQMGFSSHPDQWLSAASAVAMASPRGHRRASANFLATAHFLRSCSLCKRRLVPSRDIYMYRGDRAFCSPECRQQQMNQDERKDKCSVESKKEGTSSSTTNPEVPTKGKTTVVAS